MPLIELFDALGERVKKGKRFQSFFNKSLINSDPRKWQILGKVATSTKFEKISINRLQIFYNKRRAKKNRMSGKMTNKILVFSSLT